MKFLGQCEVCGRKVPTYRSLGQHLRHNQDAAHQQLREKWDTWRGEYRATLRCRKCGGLWEIADKSLKDKKRCPRCNALRFKLGKRRYEALTLDKSPDPRVLMTESKSKAQWDGLRSRSFSWTPGDLTYQRVLQDIEDGEHVHTIQESLGISYKVFKEIAEHGLGKKRFSQLMYRRKVEVARRMVQQAQFRSGLEDRFTDSLKTSGIKVSARNSWMTFKVAGARTHREADIKVEFSCGKKLIILCDGEVFHGPRALYVDPADRIADDVATADGFFDLGYSVCRYSESEINSGEALSHLQGVLPSLDNGMRIYRLWHPPIERWG